MKNRIFIFLLVLLFTPAIVYSHSGMISSFPAKNEVLSKSPEKIVLEFKEAVEPAFSKIEVFSSDNIKVSQKTQFSKEDKIMEAGLKKSLPAGIYIVKWKIISLDGHKLSGKYTFTIE